VSGVAEDGIKTSGNSKGRQQRSTGKMKTWWGILLMMHVSPAKIQKVQAGKLYKAYMEWCKENGHKP